MSSALLAAHCFGCGAIKRSSNRIFFTECWHFVCDVCIRHYGETCPDCRRPARLFELTDDLPSSIRYFFVNVEQQLSALKRALNFQMDLNRRFIATHAPSISRYEHSRGAYDDKKRYGLQLRQEFEEETTQIRQLREAMSKLKLRSNSRNRSSSSYHDSRNWSSSSHCDSHSRSSSSHHDSGLGRSFVENFYVAENQKRPQPPLKQLSHLVPLQMRLDALTSGSGARLPDGAFSYGFKRQPTPPPATMSRSMQDGGPSAKRARMEEQQQEDRSTWGRGTSSMSRSMQDGGPSAKRARVEEQQDNRSTWGRGTSSMSRSMQEGGPSTKRARVEEQQQENRSTWGRGTSSMSRSFHGGDGGGAAGAWRYRDSTAGSYRRPSLGLAPQRKPANPWSGGRYYRV